MPSDLNLSIVDGTLNDEPVLQRLKNSKLLLRLTIKSTERFTLHSTGEKGEHHSFIPIEILGRHVETYVKSLVVGKKYRFKGYLRTDNLAGEKNLLRLRCVNIEDWDDDEHE